MSNLLHLEDSPYLLQHKDNPVHWMPYCNEAFDKAKKENRSIFISIGYSSCHWCHVMEEKVFEDEEIAKILNEHFVCIKVDKEERPDIDKHFQGVYQLLNRRTGGWPLSIFATPQNKVFYADTYIQPETQGQKVGFTELTTIIADKIASNDKGILDNANEIENFLQTDDKVVQAATIDESIITTFLKQCEFNFEPTYGGFSLEPKFPHTSTLTTLLNVYKLTDDATAFEKLQHTLDNMMMGGMYDLVDGGFCRYSTDTKWLVPHFEKMTYDNALLCELYHNFYLTCKDEKYLNIAKESADFMLEFMSEDKLFYSASDADGESCEGEYFLYTYDEVYALLQTNHYTEDKIDEVLEYLNISKDGNFEGKNIIRLDDEIKPKFYFEVIKLLKELRIHKEYPFIDKKVQTSWNAMMIKTLFELSSTDEKYLDIAKDSLNALINKMYVNNQLKHTAITEAKVDAFLEDYAYLTRTLVCAYTHTLDETYLTLSNQFVDTAIELFYDEGKLNFSKGEFVTEADANDSSYPGSIGIFVDTLLSLAALIDEKYRNYAFKILERYSKKLMKTPLSHAYLTNQAIRYLKEDRIIKATKDNLEKLELNNYPYTQLKLVSESGYQVCSMQSCFAHSNDANEVETLIKKSL